MELKDIIFDDEVYTHIPTGMKGNVVASYYCDGATLIFEFLDENGDILSNNLTRTEACYLEKC